MLFVSGMFFLVLAYPLCELFKLGDVARPHASIQRTDCRLDRQWVETQRKFCIKGRDRTRGILLLHLPALPTPMPWCSTSLLPKYNNGPMTSSNYHLKSYYSIHMPYQDLNILLAILRDSLAAHNIAIDPNRSA